MTAISQTTFCIFYNETFFSWFEFLRSLFLRVQLTINQHWFVKWLDAEQATSYYLNQCWLSSLTCICGTNGWWVNTIMHSNKTMVKHAIITFSTQLFWHSGSLQVLGYGDAYMRQWTSVTLFRVMVCRTPVGDRVPDLQICCSEFGEW